MVDPRRPLLLTPPSRALVVSPSRPPFKFLVSFHPSRHLTIVAVDHHDHREPATTASSKKKTTPMNTLDPVQEFEWTMAVGDKTFDAEERSIRMQGCLYDMSQFCPHEKPSMVGGSLWLTATSPFFYPVLAATPAAMEKPLSHWFKPISLGAL